MQKCPCCGVNSNLYLTSRVREGVLICNECQSCAYDYKPTWYVDDKKATKALRDYFTTLGAYDIACNFSDDVATIEKLRQKAEKVRASRELKFVVYTKSQDGTNPLGEFKDQNLALARTLGWLGRIHNRVGKTQWVSAQGTTVLIDYM